MRTQRVSGSTDYTYTYEGSSLTQMTVGSNTLVFAYGANGHPMAVAYNGTSYYYITNALGDVVAIVNASGVEVVTYVYDAWGNNLSISGSMASTLGTHNPFRYRSYIYDQETGLYYLQSRYYNPTICRFISADSIGYLGADGTITSYNLFAYCNNNPVMYSDRTGHSADSVWKTILGVVVAVGLATVAIGATIVTGGTFAALCVSFSVGASISFIGQGVGNVLSGEDFFYDISVGSIIMSGLAGAAFATGIGGFWGAVGIGAASNSGISALENRSWGNILGSAIVGGFAAGIGFTAGRFVANHLPSNMGLSFNEYFDLGKMDSGLVISACHALRASWYTFLPTITTSSSRALIKYAGNKGIGWIS